MTYALKCMGGEATGVKQDGMKGIYLAIYILCYNIWIMFRDNCVTSVLNEYRLQSFR